MPKVGMQPIRRQQLIDATISSIHRHGFQETTVQRIGAEAGLSPGIIHHYFGGKEALLEATMRWLLEELRLDLKQRLEGAASPRQRVDAVLSANFDPVQFRPDVLAAWLSLWSQASYTPPLARLRNIYTRRALSNLAAPLGRLVPRDAARHIAITLVALIDGFWLRAALGDADIKPDLVLELARRTADLAIADALAAAPAATKPTPHAAEEGRD
ncbi:transcriptional regulator BetI [Radicibacter daui]|uniref:transcriptional regulator BetI n=1 Tax=Radicibacter daui TaxID=3064829 RepID=UPI004046D984